MKGMLHAALWAGAVLLPVQPVLAQSLGGAPDDGISLWRVFGVLLLCLLLGVAGAFVLRTRYGQGHLPALFIHRQRRLAVIETVRISASSSLAIVACDGAEFLVLSSAETASVISRLPLHGGGAPERLPT